MTDIAPAVQDFSFELYNKVAETPGNAVVAPYSVALVLAMAMTGARGETEAELARLLGTDQPGVYGRELLRLAGGSSDDRPDFGDDIELEVANSLWVQDGTAWNKDFLRTLAEYFSAEPELTDFGGAPADSAELINSWVAKQTRDKITNLVDPGMFDAMTRMVLANAAYFKAPWETRFDPARPGTFTTDQQTVVTAEMMPKTFKRVGYRRGEEWQSVILPFRGERLAMGLVLPDEGVALSATTASIGQSGLGGLLSGLRRAPEIQVELPRWKFTLRTQLNDALAALGLSTAFDDRCDLAGMSDTEPLQVSSVVHQAFVAVDEEGAEAAAATGMTIVARSAPARPLKLIFDRPFMFLIFDQESQLPLFIGRVADPTQG